MKKFLWLTIPLLFLFSCEISTNSSNKGNIAGTITRSPIMSASSSLDSIMVILIDAEFEPDTVECDNNAAFLDTVYTDTTGTFLFENVEQGNYYIYPISNYIVSSIENPLDSLISISGEANIELSYIASPISLSGFYSITVNLKNVPNNYTANFVGILRKEWIFFVPGWKDVSVNETDYSNGVYSCTFGMVYGYSYGVYTLTNAYKLEYGNSIYTVNYNLVYEISTPITNTPEEVEFDIDASTGEVTRIK